MKTPEAEKCPTCDILCEKCKHPIDLLNENSEVLGDGKFAHMRDCRE